MLFSQSPELSRKTAAMLDHQLVKLDQQAVTLIDVGHQLFDLCIQCLGIRCLVSRFESPDLLTNVVVLLLQCFS